MIYWAIRAIVTLLARLLTQLEVEGLENVPASGPFILITNHLSYLDPPIFMVAFPFRVTMLAASKYRRHPFGLLIRLVNPIWVRRGEADRQAIRQCLRVLAGGNILGMAPEGTRSRSGGLQRGKPGAAYLALKAGVPLLPAVVTGTEKALQAWLHLRRPRIRVVIGKPFRLEARGAERQLDALTDEMMARLAELLPPAYRGVYGQQEEDPRTWALDAAHTTRKATS